MTVQASHFDTGSAWQADDIAAAIRSFRFTYATEDLLQQGLADALGSRGFRVEREVPLSSRDRIDLLVENVGVEVKIAGTAEAVLRQVTRYLASDRLAGLVLVTGRVRHQLPATIHGKPVAVVRLAAAAL